MAKINQRPNNISTKIRKAKALPVIKGKNRLLDTINGIKAIATKPVKIVQFKALFSFMKKTIARKVTSHK